MSENTLYKPIEDMFLQKGYFSISARTKLPNEKVHSSFAVNVHEVTKQVDTVAFKWERNGDLEAKAVECKPGKTWEAAAKALGQATAYQRTFPEVYVATEADEDELKHVESTMRQLGLGYIMVKDRKAEEIFPPSENIRFNKGEFELQVKGKAACLFAGLDVFGKDSLQFGRANEPYFIWVSSTDQPCNVVCSFNYTKGRSFFWLALNLERKRAIERLFGSVKAKELHDVLAKLPPGYSLYLRRIKSRRPEKEYSQKEESPVHDMTLRRVEDVKAKISEWSWEAHFQVGKEFSPEVYSRGDISTELEETVAELSPLKRLIDSLTKT